MNKLAAVNSFLLLRITLVILCFILIVVKPNQLNAQSNILNDVSLTNNYHFGYNLPEYQMFNYYTNSYVQSLDFCITKQSFGKDYWQQLFNYPEYGLSFFYSTLGNDEIYGRELAVNYFFKVHFIKKKHFSVYNRTGIGLDYVSEIFNQETNPFNTATGSHLNMHFNLRLGAHFRINQKMGLNTGLSFDHFSNANASEPNLGINYVTTYAGLSYKIGKETVKQKHEIPSHVKNNSFAVFVNFGGKHTRALSSDYFITTSTAFEFKHELLRSFHIGTGIDLFYDASVKKQLNNAEREYRSSYLFQSGIHISQTFSYNKFSITIQEGIYLLLEEKVNNQTMYNRAILQYQAAKMLYIRLAMKSHLHILDYPELGIGIKL
ncbi:MAG: acyloxyacyl hydrolase [Salinivirgaceae bacterium]|nr:acyloxyacyl hydrolase [Salinivirgaceae bacterium]